MLTRSHILTAAAALSILAIACWTPLPLHAQSPPAQPVWEYATVEDLMEEYQVTRKVSTANICYHTPSGCRWETIRVTVDRSGRINDALAAALARLGEKGWEAVSMSPTTSQQRPAVLMKRLRPADNPPN